MARGGYAPLVEVRRGEVVESLHVGAIAVVDSGGRLVASAGDPGVPVVLRSTAKPVQVLPLIDSGAADRFGFGDEAIAVMMGSHGGELFHVRAVRDILRVIGLDESALQCGAHAPYHRPSARALRESGQEPTALHNNCSGKHAGMLALAVHLKAPVDRYLEPAHPVQELIRERLAGLAGGRDATAGGLIDGCSAPTFAMPLSRLALVYARLVASTGGAGEDPSARRAVTAMRAHPRMIAGTGRLCTRLMRQGGRRGLLAKIGAEGMYALAWMGDGIGYGMGLKIADGNGERGRFSATIEALLQLGILSRERASDLRARFVGQIRNHRGLVVGEIAPAFHLTGGML